MADGKLNFEISPQELKRKLDAGEPLTLLDVREPWEHETAHIAGSRLIPMGEIPARAEEALDPAQHIVVLCHHGVRSLDVTGWLRQQRFEKVQSTRGGIDAWSRLIDPTVPRY